MCQLYNPINKFIFSIIIFIEEQLVIHKSNNLVSGTGFHYDSVS